MRKFWYDFDEDIYLQKIILMLCVHADETSIELKASLDRREFAMDRSSIAKKFLVMAAKARTMLGDN